MDERAGIVAVICPTPWARSNEPFPVSRVDCDPAPVWVADRVKSTLGAAAEFEAEAARVPWAAAEPFPVEPDVPPPKTAASTAASDPGPSTAASELPLYSTSSLIRTAPFSDLAAPGNARYDRPFQSIRPPAGHCINGLRRSLPDRSDDVRAIAGGVPWQPGFRPWPPVPPRAPFWRWPGADNLTQPSGA